MTHVEVLRDMLAICTNVRRLKEADALTAAIKALEAIGNAQRIYGYQTLVAGKSEGSTPFLLIPADAVGGG